VDKLDELRKQINQIDDSIVELVQKRVKCAKNVGKLKDSEGSVVYDPGRELKILRRLSEKLQPPVTEKDISNIFREIISLCRNIEKPQRIAFLGPEDTFTHMAAVQRFGYSATHIPVASFPKVFDAVENNRADYGLVAIENSSQGTVPATVDSFLDSQLKICAEVYIEAVHNLVSKHPLSEIKTVYSHPQGLAQCRLWLEKNLPNADLIDVSSTAQGAAKAAVTPNTGAISSRPAAEKHNLDILAESIQDISNNITRFLVVGHHDGVRSGHDKTSMILLVHNRPGALFESLRYFSELNINLLKIDSRPTRREAWEYAFFIDCDGHREDEKIKKVLAQLEEKSLYVKLLGSYPAETHGTL
jgi:chorismate mutase / prephenate dehydratase